MDRGTCVSGGGRRSKLHRRHVLGALRYICSNKNDVNVLEGAPGQGSGARKGEG